MRFELNPYNNLINGWIFSALTVQLYDNHRTKHQGYVSICECVRCRQGSSFGEQRRGVIFSLSLHCDRGMWNHSELADNRGEKEKGTEERKHA